MEMPLVSKIRMCRGAKQDIYWGNPGRASVQRPGFWQLQVLLSDPLL